MFVVNLTSKSLLNGVCIPNKLNDTICTEEPRERRENKREWTGYRIGFFFISFFLSVVESELLYSKEIGVLHGDYTSKLKLILRLYFKIFTLDPFPWIIENRLCPICFGLIIDIWYQIKSMLETNGRLTFSVFHRLVIAIFYA